MKKILMTACLALFLVSLGPVPGGFADEAAKAGSGHERLDELGDDAIQGVSGHAVEKVIEQGMTGSGLIGPKAPLPEAVKGKVKTAVLKGAPAAAATALTTISDLAPAMGQHAGGDYRKAFSEASGSFAGAAAGFLASSLCATPLGAVAAGVGVGFIAKQGVRAIAEEYNQCLSKDDLYAALCRLEPDDSLRERMGKLQEEMEKAREANHPDSVAEIGKEQAEVAEKFKNHRRCADEMSRAMANMAAAIEQGQAAVRQKREAYEEQRKMTDAFYRSWREADDEREKLARALARESKAGKLSREQIQAAREQLEALTDLTKSGFQNLKEQEAAGRELEIAMNHAGSEVEAMEERFRDQVREFKINAEQMYGKTVQEGADGIYEGEYDYLEKPSGKPAKMKIQISGTHATCWWGVPAVSVLIGNFDPGSGSLSLSGSYQDRFPNGNVYTTKWTMTGRLKDGHASGTILSEGGWLVNFNWRWNVDKK